MVVVVVVVVVANVYKSGGKRGGHWPQTYWAVHLGGIHRRRSTCIAIAHITVATPHGCAAVSCLWGGGARSTAGGRMRGPGIVIVWHSRTDGQHV